MLEPRDQCHSSIDSWVLPRSLQPRAWTHAGRRSQRNESLRSKKQCCIVFQWIVQFLPVCCFWGQANLPWAHQWSSFENEEGTHLVTSRLHVVYATSTGGPKQWDSQIGRAYTQRDRNYCWKQRVLWWNLESHVKNSTCSSISDKISWQENPSYSEKGLWLKGQTRNLHFKLHNQDCQQRSCAEKRWIEKSNWKRNESSNGNTWLLLLLLSKQNKTRDKCSNFRFVDQGWWSIIRSQSLRQQKYSWFLDFSYAHQRWLQQHHGKYQTCRMCIIGVHQERFRNTQQNLELAIFTFARRGRRYWSQRPFNNFYRWISKETFSSLDVDSNFFLQIIQFWTAESRNRHQPWTR